MSFRTLTLVVLASNILSIAGLAVYDFSNSSNHTGMDPNNLLILLIPSIMLALFGLALKKTDKKLVIVLALVAVGGIFYLIYLDQTNALISYEKWISRGMP